VDQTIDPLIESEPMNFQMLTDLPWYYVLPGVVFVLTVLFAIVSHSKSRPVTHSTTVESYDDRARIYDTSPLGEEATSFLAEKREALRRDGQTVVVHMSLDLQGNRSEEAFVTDRSKTGLRIVTKRRVKVGALIRVRAENAPDNTPWVIVEVCRSTKHRKYYELGCQFTAEVPWNVLLLFG